jgi:hypothetical protein
MRRTLEEAHEAAWEKAQQDLKRLEPYKAAYTAGCDYHASAVGGHFTIRFFDQDYRVTFPEVSVQDAAGEGPDVATRLILLHYLIHADGTPPADQWIAFRELPDGLVYDPAFQGRSSLRLRREYGIDARGFAAAAEKVGGEPLTFGDASYMFRVLPRLRMAVILHQGDEEFGPAVNVLFDGSAGHYLPTEDLAVVGGMLVGRLIKAGIE